MAIQADVTRATDVRQLVSRASEELGPIDVLVNNAGSLVERLKLLDLTEERWDYVMDLNLKSAFLCAQAVAPSMMERKDGAIINVSSIAGVVGLSGSAGAVAYTTTKAGLQGFTLSIAADCAAEGIRANCLIVGTVYTPMAMKLGEEGRERRRKLVPLQTEGTGWDVGHAAVYLASDEARWVTGVMLPIDGGFSAIREWPR